MSTQGSYVVITPCRDEQATIGLTLRSMIEQRVRPARWVIVDDGSTDGTPEIVAGALQANPWIELVRRSDRGFRALGGGVVEAFNEGLERVRGLDWDFVVKLDADLSFDPGYFATLLERFAQMPSLGMASGKTFLVQDGIKRIEWCHDDHVRGPAKMYSRACFETIGGLKPVRGWDMIDETRARMSGFVTRSFPDLELIHHRPIDARQANVLRSRYEMGALYWYLGYDWLYHLVRSARSALQDYPRGLGGLMLLVGFLSSALRRAPRYDPDYVEFVRREQRQRFSWSHLREFLGSIGARS